MFVNQWGFPIETSLRVYRRFFKYDPALVEDLIDFLVRSGLWQKAAERLAAVLNDDRLWLELFDLLTQHAAEISGLNVIRGGITDEGVI